MFFTSKTQYLVRCPFCYLCIGLFQKKSKRELRIHFFKTPPEIFHFFTLSLEIPDKTKLDTWIFHRIVLDPLEIPRPKNVPLDFTHYFHPLEILLFLLTPGNSTCYFFDNPGNSISSAPPCFDFFLE